MYFLGLIVKLEKRSEEALFGPQFDRFALHNLDSALTPLFTPTWPHISTTPAAIPIKKA